MEEGEMRSRVTIVCIFSMLLLIIPFATGEDVVDPKFETTRYYPVSMNSLHWDADETAGVIFITQKWDHDVLISNTYGEYDLNHSIGLHLNFYNEAMSDSVIDIRVSIDTDGDGSFEIVAYFGQATIPYRVGGLMTLVDRGPDSITGDWVDLDNGTVKLSIKKVSNDHPDVRLDMSSSSYITTPFHQTRPYAVIESVPSTRDRINTTLNGTNSYDPNGDDLIYSWDFYPADGIQIDAEGPIITHVFNETGYQYIALTVSDGTFSDTKKIRIDVKKSHPPIAAAGNDRTVDRNEEFYLSGTGSQDHNDDPLNFTWDMENGDILYGQWPQYSYSIPGTYEVVLYVTDGLDTVNDTVIITVNENAPPVAEFFFNDVVRFGEPITFNATPTYDPEEDEMVSFHWDFGDGNTAQGIIVNHSYFVSGDFMVILNVSDGMDEGVSKWVVKVPENGIPTGEMSFPDYAFNGSVTNFNVIDVVDPEGANCTIVWDMGDGTIIHGRDVNHTHSDPGSYNISITITDEYGGVNHYHRDLQVLDTTLFKPTQMMVEDNISMILGVETGWYFITYENRQFGWGNDMIAHYTPMGGARYFGLDLPVDKKFKVRVEVIEGGNIDVLLVNEENLGIYDFPNLHGDTYMEWENYGTDLDTIGHEFIFTGGSLMYMIVGNNGKMENGATPVDIVKFNITVEFVGYKEKEIFRPIPSSENEENAGFRGTAIVCATVVIALIVILIIVIVLIISVVKKGKRDDKIPDEQNDKIVLKIEGFERHAETEAGPVSPHPIDPFDTGKDVTFQNPSLASAPPGYEEPGIPISEELQNETGGSHLDDMGTLMDPNDGISALTDGTNDAVEGSPDEASIDDAMKDFMEMGAE